VGIREVAEYLGHTDPGFTLRIYAHLMPSAADRLSAAMDASLSSLAAVDSPVAGRALEG
jgi:integrase